MSTSIMNYGHSPVKAIQKILDFPFFLLELFRFIHTVKDICQLTPFFVILNRGILLYSHIYTGRTCVFHRIHKPLIKIVVKIVHTKIQSTVCLLLYDLPSMMGLASRICCSIQECWPDTAARNWRISLVLSVLPAPDSPLGRGKGRVGTLKTDYIEEINFRRLL